MLGRGVPNNVGDGVTGWVTEGRGVADSWCEGRGEGSVVAVGRSDTVGSAEGVVEGVGRSETDGVRLMVGTPETAGDALGRVPDGSGETGVVGSGDGQGVGVGCEG